MENNSFTIQPSHMPITAAIVDDEPQFRELLSSLLGKRFPEITVLGVAGSVAEGSTLVREKRPDLLFLDVEMGDMNGFDLLKRIAPFEMIHV